MATIRDVAKHASVSVATMSRVINNPDKVSKETHHRVQRSIESLGFEPGFSARTWCTQETCTIAAVMSDNIRPHCGATL
jgi:DNA-binding LacI/PurR family transcriptional regulator